MRPNMALSQAGREFIHCALDPFGADAAMIPDGGIEKRVRVKYKVVCQLAPVTGHISMSCALVPGLPGGLRITDGNVIGLARGGSAITQNVGPNAAATGCNAITIPFTDFVNSNGYTMNNLAGITAARVISYGMIIRPTTPLLSQGGVQATVRVDPGISPSAEGASSGFDATIGDPAIAASNGYPIKLRQMRLPLNSLTYDNITTFPDSKVCSGTKPCWVLGTPSCYEWEDVCPVYSSTLLGDPAQAMAMDTALLVNNGTYLTTVTSTTPAGVGQVIGYNRWTNLNASLNGAVPLFPVAADAAAVGDFWTSTCCDTLAWAANAPTAATMSSAVTYEIVAVQCMELVIRKDASIYRPFSVPGPPVDTKAIEVVRDVVRDIPASVTVEDEDTWWSRLTTGVSSIGRLVADIGIPVVSPISGMVSTISSALGKLRL